MVSGMARGRGEYTEKRLSGLRQLHQKMKVLEAGESSHTHRIRASEAVNEWFKSLSAEERGRLITSLYDAQTGATPVEIEREQRPVTSATPVRSPQKKLSGKAAELFDLLSSEGAVMVKAGNRYEVRRGGEVLGDFSGATGGALLTRDGLLTSLSADSWELTRKT